MQVPIAITIEGGSHDGEAYRTDGNQEQRFLASYFYQSSQNGTVGAKIRLAAMKAWEASREGEASPGKQWEMYVVSMSGPQPDGSWKVVFTLDE